MKEKIKAILKILLSNWTKFAEIGTVIWAINGIMSSYRSFDVHLGRVNVEYHIVPVLAYFFSTVLILYLLRKYGKKN